MPRLFNLRVKNKCSPCNGIYLLLLCSLSLLIMLLLHRELESQREGTLVAPPPRRLFCIIVTYEYRHEHAAIHILRTWAKHCDHFLFVSDNIHHFLEPAVFMHLNRWQRIRAHLEYVYGYHFHQGDWILYANDDNFVVVENLRQMLSSYSPDEHIYFGCKLKTPKGLAFMHQDSGIVFSRAALERFVLEALPNTSICNPDRRDHEASEELGRCLTNLNVIAGDSRDEWLGHRFVPFEADLHLGGQMNQSQEQHKYFLDHSYYPVIDLSMPVSLQLICCHMNYIMNIYDLYYFTYMVRIFGGQQVPKDVEEKVIWNKKVAAT